MSNHKRYMTHIKLRCPKSKTDLIYMSLCPCDYHENGFVVNHAPGHIACANESKNPEKSNKGS